MLLTLSINSLLPHIKAEGLQPMDIPEFASQQFGLTGLHLTTSYLAGFTASMIDELRDASDKAGCPCLVLVEDTPHPLAREADDSVMSALERIKRVANVAHRLGCPALAFSITDENAEDADEHAAENIKELLRTADKLELNLLIKPIDGLTNDPDRLTSLIRAIGGFRIGSCPSFAQAAASDDPVVYLKAVAPYASCIVAETSTFDAKAQHKAFDISACMEAIQAVGFDGSLAIEPDPVNDPLSQIQRCADHINDILAGQEA